MGVGVLRGSASARAAGVRPSVADRTPVPVAVAEQHFIGMLELRHAGAGLVCWLSHAAYVYVGSTLENIFINAQGGSNSAS